jgi:hypothetical protein
MSTLQKRYMELMRLRIRVAEAEIDHSRRQLGEKETIKAGPKVSEREGTW